MKLATLLASAAATALAAPASSPASGINARQFEVLYPYQTFRYWVQTGAVKEDPRNQPLVLKNGNQADETTTILTFQVPPEFEGRRCQLHFELWDRDVSTGSHQADVFTVIDPPTGDVPAANLKNWRPAKIAETERSRDVHQGRVEVEAPGIAEWIESFHGYPEFDCPAGTLFAIEYVGVNDAVEISWDIGVTGPTLRPIF